MCSACVTMCLCGSKWFNAFYLSNIFLREQLLKIIMIRTGGPVIHRESIHHGPALRTHIVQGIGHRVEFFQLAGLLIP